MNSEHARAPHLAGHAAHILDDIRHFLLFLRNAGHANLDCSENAMLRVLAWNSRPTPLRDNLERIRRDLDDCGRCSLSDRRTSIVFGEGDPDADLMFIGDGPGYEDDLQGRPFADDAGRLLTDIVRATGLTRDRVYICTLLKCRLPDNRTPLPSQIAACLPFAHRQIAAVRPRCICALGAVAARALLNSTEPITRLRGRFHDFGGVRLMPTFHPAYILRNSARKGEVWQDIKQIMGFLNLPVPPRKKR